MSVSILNYTAVIADSHEALEAAAASAKLSNYCNIEAVTEWIETNFDIVYYKYRRSDLPKKYSLPSFAPEQTFP